MAFEWDSEKEAANRQKHGVDFTLALTIFASTVVTREDLRRDYGEPRHISIGEARNGEIIVCVWTPRGENRRLISAWKGGRDEEEHYRQYVA